MKRLMKLTTALALAGLMAACGGDDDDSGAGDPAHQDLIDAMVSEGATADEAGCFIDELGFDDAERIYGADEADLSEGDMDDAVAAFEKCGAMEGDSSGGDGDEEAAGDEAASGDLSEVRACIDDAGVSTFDSTAPADLQESLGVLDSFDVGTESGGVGNVNLYGDVDSATSAEEFQADAYADGGPTIGRVDAIVYLLSGGTDDDLAAIEGCL